MALTADQVRALVRDLPEATEGAHHGHPDFRVRTKIFASLSEDESHVALRLGCVEARALAEAEPAVYRLVSDREPHAWVSIALEAADPTVFADLLETAWRERGGGAATAASH
jgi:hypothetical protein